MKRKLLIALVTLLCVLMVGSVFLTALSIAQQSSGANGSQDGSWNFDLLAEEQTFNTTTPNWFYDFTNEEIQSIFSISNMVSYSCNKTDGYTTFTAGAAPGGGTVDPHIYFESAPTCKPSEALYMVVVYRTNLSVRSEFFNTRTDTGNMGQPGTNLNWVLNGSGEWVTEIVPCTAWANAIESSEFTAFRFDPLEQYGTTQVPVGGTIDMKCAAFFATQEDASNFNLDEYLRKLAYEKQLEQEKEDAANNVQWPDPTYKDMETVAKDSFGGTLTYTPSADGKTVTISYSLNDETVQYTVPNNANYLTGGYAGVDDLDRSLYDSQTVGSYKADERYVGLFYFLWQGEHGDSGIFNLQQIIDKVGVEAAGNVSCGLYGPGGAMHYFAEPLYGYYYANDAWVMRKHAELLTNANIDFLYIDVTNGYPYTRNALQLMEILHELNEQGYDAPQVVFYTNTNPQYTIQCLYNDIYKVNKYPDTWFCIDGKPVVIAPVQDALFPIVLDENNTPVADFFTVKEAQWPNDPQYKVNAWPWMDFEWPQRVFTDSEGNPSAISVSIAQHSGTVRFSDSSLYNNNMNRGRSFANPNGYPSTETSRFKRALQVAYKDWQNNPALTNQGLNFQAQFDYAIESPAQYILVTGWNEWVAQRQDLGDGSIVFIDTSSMEFSRDAEMMRGGYFDNYYMQLVYNVQRVKGTAPVILQDSRKPINVTGDFDQWDDVVVSYQDPVGDDVDRDATGFGKTQYTNTTGRNDIVNAKVTHDTKNLYFYIETKHNVSMFNADSSWMQIYLNTDRKTTGWYGYDYIINYQAKDTFTTHVAAYNGQDGAYGFASAGEVSYRAKGNQMMIAVPMEMLGITNYKELNFEFKIADSTTVYDEMEDFYCDGDVAPLGRLNYVFQNYIPGVSTNTAPDPVDTQPTDTSSGATPDSFTDTTATTTPGTTAGSGDSNKKGCASLMGTAAIAVLIPVVGAAMVCRNRKKED